MKFIKIDARDNVAVALQVLRTNEKCEGVALVSDIMPGHKVALCSIKKGEDIIKYARVIGRASKDIHPGEHVHTHNTLTTLDAAYEYEYNYLAGQNPVKQIKMPDQLFFRGYLRNNGNAAIRNEIWIIPTVGCVNEIAKVIRNRADEKFRGAISKNGFEGIEYFPHPYGCSQLGDDHATTQKILANLALHPNAGGVLVLGLGCENNLISEFKKKLGDYDKERIRFLAAQDVEDEVESSLDIISELVSIADGDVRQTLPVSMLNIGLKCGGSDGLSGITANPLVGVFSDMHTGLGGTTVLTEVPEMFGAETILFSRCISEEVFCKAVDMVNSFKDYYISNGQVVYENPSPGNKDGGITTLEDKSIGCVQKGGSSPVADVLKYCDVLSVEGLNLLEGPGNDLVAVTALAAAKCHIVLFTTGRGTPLGSPVPVIKVSSNTELYKRKKHWIDFDAGVISSGADMYDCATKLYDHVISVASGDIKTCNELNGCRDMAIFKNGVTL